MNLISSSLLHLHLYISTCLDAQDVRVVMQEAEDNERLWSTRLNVEPVARELETHTIRGHPSITKRKKKERKRKANRRRSSSCIELFVLVLFLFYKARFPVVSPAFMIFVILIHITVRRFMAILLPRRQRDVIQKILIYVTNVGVKTQR